MLDTHAESDVDEPFGHALGCTQIAPFGASPMDRTEGIVPVHNGGYFACRTGTAGKIDGHGL